MSQPTGVRLSEQAKAIVCAALVSSKSGEEINRMLVNSGFEPVSAHTLSKYRQSAEVKELLDLALQDVKEQNFISLRSRLDLLQRQIGNLLSLIETHNEPCSRDYNSKLKILVAYMREVSLLVDRFQTDRFGNSAPDVPQPPPAMTAGQIADVIEVYIRQHLPEKAKLLPPPSWNVQRVLDEQAQHDHADA